MKLTPNKRALLAYLREETFTICSIAKEVLNQNSMQAANQQLKRMVSDGLLIDKRVVLPGGQLIVIYGITEIGQSYAWDLDEEITNSKYFEPSKVYLSTLQHELDMQLMHVKAEKIGWTHWKNAKHLGFRKTNIKYPDAIGTSPEGTVYCIEIERQIKSTARIRQIIASHLAMRKCGYWDTILYLSPTLDLAQRLKRKFSSVGHVNWENKRIEITDAHLAPFQFKDYNFFESCDRSEKL